MYKNYLQVNKISCNTIQYNNFTSREKSNRVRIYKNTYNMQKLKKNIRYTKKQKKNKISLRYDNKNKKKNNGYFLRHAK